MNEPSTLRPEDGEPFDASPVVLHTVARDIDPETGDLLHQVVALSDDGVDATPTLLVVPNRPEYAHLRRRMLHDL